MNSEATASLDTASEGAVTSSEVVASYSYARASVGGQGGEERWGRTRRRVRIIRRRVTAVAGAVADAVTAAYTSASTAIATVTGTIVVTADVTVIVAVTVAAV